MVHKFPPSLPIGWIGDLAGLILAPSPYVSHSLLYVSH